MSNWWSRTQTGWSSPSGTRRSLRVKSGTSRTRASIPARIVANEYASGIVDGSSTISPHTCMSWAGVSR